MRNYYILIISTLCFINKDIDYKRYIAYSFKKDINMDKASDTSITNKKVTDENPVLISDKFSFTEGPACDKEGNVFFSDQPNNQIWKYDTNGKLSLFMQGCGRSNGMYFDADGNLISCADEHNELWSIDAGKKAKVLCTGYNNGIFNGPNDVWVNKKTGGIYFTDPFYERDYWNKDHKHMQAQNVYYLAKGSAMAVIADDSLQKPNGIIGTTDGKYLYVSDIGAGKTFKYEIAENGHLINKKLFVSEGSDGMTLDTNDNLYITGNGVTVFNAAGQKIQHIPINEKWTGNVCFSGKDMHTLFITASKSIYAVKMNVAGIQ